MLFFETKPIGRRSMVGLDLAGDLHEFGQIKIEEEVSIRNFFWVSHVRHV